MPANIGAQTVTLLHYTSATSPNVNRRQLDITQKGIYSGGRLSITDGITRTMSLSPLVCEITDGTYQVRIATTIAVAITGALATPYIVLRWLYAGTTADYMEILQVATPAANDIVVGKCSYAAGVLQGFDYGNATYPRTTPNTLDLFLKVEPTEATELKVRIRAGRVQSYSDTSIVDDQKSSLFTAPSANSKVYLVYVDTTDGTINIDSAGTEAASPEAPSYAGKVVLAEVTLASTSTNITASMIKDVRSYTPAKMNVNQYFASYNTATQAKYSGVWTKALLGNVKNESGITHSNDQISFTAGRKYALSFSVSGLPSSSSTADPYFKARWAVVSGDTSWNLELISLAWTECAHDYDTEANIANTVYFIPSVTTVLELQLLAENSGQKAEINHVSINIMSLD